MGASVAGLTIEKQPCPTLGMGAPGGCDERAPSPVNIAPRAEALPYLVGQPAGADSGKGVTTQSPAALSRSAQAFASL